MPCCGGGARYIGPQAPQCLFQLRLIYLRQPNSRTRLGTTRDDTLYRFISWQNNRKNGAKLGEREQFSGDNLLDIKLLIIVPPLLNEP